MLMANGSLWLFHNRNILLEREGKSVELPENFLATCSDAGPHGLTCPPPRVSYGCFTALRFQNNRKAACHQSLKVLDKEIARVMKWTNGSFLSWAPKVKTAKIVCPNTEPVTLSLQGLQQIIISNSSSNPHVASSMTMTVYFGCY